jgi:hypothetical protein
MIKKFGITKKILIMAVFVSLILAVYFFILAVVLSSPKNESQIPTSVMVILPAPTNTPVPTTTPVGQNTGTVIDPSGITLGMYVQITGTSGSGLNIRSGAGVNYSPNFLANDAEVFLVKEGPIQADGFYWWYLVAPYDEKRNGWAASQYLTIVNNP